MTSAKLAAMLAIATGKQKKVCDDFLEEFFSIIEEELVKGENVRIKGFGTFKLVEVEPRKSVNVATGEDTTIPGHTKVLFVAAKELAALVNSPFEAFEAVEVADELPTDMLDGDEFPDEMFETGDNEESEEIESNKDPSAATVEAESEVVMSEEKTNSEAYGKEPVGSDAEKPIIQKEPKESDDKLFQDIDPDMDSGSENMDPGEDAQGVAYEETEVPDGSHHRFAWGFISGFLCALVVAGVIFAFGYFMGYSFGLTKVMASVEDSSTPSSVIAQISEQDDSGRIGDDTDVNNVQADDGTTGTVVKDKENGDDVPTEASDGPIYDVVTTTRYLTTIAKEHYGNFNLWPVIYEENKSFLGHPDRIRPGTKVVVPPLSKYGIDPHNAGQIKEIKRRGIEIYSKFK